jgi:GTP-binding protein HflX
MQSVHQILGDLGLDDKHIMMVWNKSDAAPRGQVERLINQYGGIALSAATGEGCDQLLVRVENALFTEKLTKHWNHNT